VRAEADGGVVLEGTSRTMDSMLLLALLVDVCAYMWQIMSFRVDGDDLDLDLNQESGQGESRLIFRRTYQRSAGGVGDGLV